MEHWPSVSVVIPARNAERTIRKTLRAALSQDYQGDLEVIVAVAVGSGNDTTAEIVRREFPQVRVIPNPRRIIPSGLNRAIEAARYDVIVRCDAHAAFPPGYVRSVVLDLERTGAACVGGMQVPVGSGFFSKAVALSISSPLGSGNSYYKVGGQTGPVDTVYLGAYSRSALDAVGRYDESLPVNEDYELNWRIRQSGGTVWLDPELKVEYQPRATLRELAGQYWRYGLWKARMLRRNPMSVRARQIAPPFTLLALLASLAGGLATGSPWAGLPFPAVYLGGLLAGGLLAGVQRRDPAAVLLPLTLATMHLSWGAGFLSSILTPRRWPRGPLTRTHFPMAWTFLPRGLLRRRKGGYA